MNRVNVRRARTRPSGRGGHYNWVVTQNKADVSRQFVFRYFSTAVREADRLARTNTVRSMHLVSVQEVWPHG